MLPPVGPINNYLVFRQDEDIVLTNVVAFDVQVFDSSATVRDVNNEVAVGPTDPGYNGAAGAPATFGAFIDLGSLVTHPLTGQVTPFGSRSWLQTNYANLLQSNGLSSKAIYDTWSLSYERDGINQTTNPNGAVPDPFIDTGADGLDNNSNGVTDELAEYEAPPPYTAALRGIKIILRVIDPDTRQVAQTTIIADFTPY